MQPIRTLPLCLLGAVLAASVMRADPTTTIDFSNLQPFADYSYVPAGYGSNAANTPDITVSYSTLSSTSGTVADPTMELWNTGYANLPAVAYPSYNGDYADIALTPAAGYEVTLDSFEFGGYPTGDGTWSNQTLLVDDASYTPLVSYGNGTLTVSDASATLYQPDVTSDGAINIVFGPEWDIGINDIVFSESPIPSQSNSVPDAAGAAGLMILGLTALAAFSRGKTASAFLG